MVPKVLQGFWVPPPSTFLNMPSQQLSEMAVGVNSCTEPTDVEDDAEAMSIYAKDVDVRSLVWRRTRLCCHYSAVVSFPPAPLTASAERPAGIGLDDPAEQPVPCSEPDSAVVPAPPPSDEPPTITAIQEGLTISQTELNPSPETDSAVVSFQPPPLTISAEPAVTTSVLLGEVMSEEPR